MIVYMIGRMLGVEGLLLLVPALVSFLYGEQSGIAFLLTAAILLIIFLLAGGLEEIAPELAPSTLVTASEDFIRNRVIPYTDHHIAPEETDTLRICAARSLRNQK